MWTYSGDIIGTLVAMLLWIATETKNLQQNSFHELKLRALPTTKKVIHIIKSNLMVFSFRYTYYDHTMELYIETKNLQQHSFHELKLPGVKITHYD